MDSALLTAHTRSPYRCNLRRLIVSLQPDGNLASPLLYKKVGLHIAVHSKAFLLLIFNSIYIKSSLTPDPTLA